MKPLHRFMTASVVVWCLATLIGRVVPPADLPFAHLLAAQTPPWIGDWCGIQVVGETSDRYVTGSVNTECNPCWLHSAPYGNWGVDSFFGNRYDGAQYKGWATNNPNCNESMDDPEWNSCTSTFTSSTYYNYPSGSPYQQFSGDTTSIGAVFDWYQTIEEDGCSVLDQSTLAGGTVLEIYELDDGLGDDHVTDLTVYSGSGSLSCNRDGCAETSTSWGSNSNYITSALFRVRVAGSCHWVEGKGCT